MFAQAQRPNQVVAALGVEEDYAQALLLQILGCKVEEAVLLLRFGLEMLPIAGRPVTRQQLQILQ